MAQAPPETPPYVVQYGWRDSPYEGEDRCMRCSGWGTTRAWFKTDDRQIEMHTNCPKCSGTGHG